MRWFEEPVSSDDLDGLRLIRDRAPAGMDIAAGEYGYDLSYFRRMLEAGAVDVLQADATRCAGHHRLSARRGACRGALRCRSRRTAPRRCTLTRAARCRTSAIWNIFTIMCASSICFSTGLTPGRGELRPDLSRPGLGLEFKRKDAARYAV